MVNSIVRGSRVLAVDGTDINSNTNAGIDVLNAGLFPTAINQTHSFSILDPGAGVARTVTMTTANVTSTPVLNTRTLPGNPTVGYMLFNDHVATAEQGLIAAITALKIRMAQQA